MKWKCRLKDGVIARHDDDEGEGGATLTLTHEEIAETIGASRETVTRLLAEFKRKNLIEVRGSTLVISKRNALQQLLEA